jgi:DNA-directed RNA polymerase subunit RPC12/RpoP
MRMLQKRPTEGAGGDGGLVRATLAEEVRALMTGARCFSCGGTITSLSLSTLGDVLVCTTCGAEMEEIEDPAGCAFVKRLSSAA